MLSEAFQALLVLSTENAILGVLLCKSQQVTVLRKIGNVWKVIFKLYFEKRKRREKVSDKRNSGKVKQSRKHQWSMGKVRGEIKHRISSANRFRIYAPIQERAIKRFAMTNEVIIYLLAFNLKK